MTMCQHMHHNLWIWLCLIPLREIGMMLCMHSYHRIQEKLSQNPGKIVTKYNFLALLKKAWDKTMTASNICAWFRSSRIYPFSREKVQPVVLNISEEDENVSKYWYILCYICKSKGVTM